MIILGIETSCDETAISVVKANGDLNKPHFEILSSSLFSQAKIHAEYGGVFPFLAKREHAKNIPHLLKKTLLDANLIKEKKSQLTDKIKIEIKSILQRESDLAEELITLAENYSRPNIELVTFTTGPGLEPALWVGINTARALSIIWEIEIKATNHMEGHIASVLFTKETYFEYPLLALLISGGHTELVIANRPIEYERVGSTRDDAVGEAFDKVARMLELPYPGGPEISRLAQSARDKKLDKGEWSFPRPMKDSDNFDFSFSGLKTAVLYAIRRHQTLGTEDKERISREFEDAVSEVLLKKTNRFISDFSINTLVVAGGVIANSHIRKEIQTLEVKFPKLNIYFPSVSLSTDNATMICAAGYLRFLKEGKDKNSQEVEAKGTMDYQK